MRNFESQTFYYYCNYRVSFCFIIYIHMNGNHMNNDRTLSLSTVTHIINAPLEKVDISDWLFNLSDAEYQSCSHLHTYIAAGTTTSDDGHPMRINVETIGEALMVQRFFCANISAVDSILTKLESYDGVKEVRDFIGTRRVYYQDWLKREVDKRIGQSIYYHQEQQQ
jgi:hypothetical protein